MTPPSITRTVDWWAHRQPHATAIVDGRGHTTYRELAAGARQVTRALRARGVGPGRVVATAVLPDAAWVALLLGSLRAGVVLAPLSDRLTAPELAVYLDRLAPDLVLASPQVGRWGAEVPTDRPVAFVGPATGDALACRLRATVGDDRHGDDRDDSAGAGPAVAFPTGGTTGTPKAALWSERGLALATFSSVVNLELHHRDRELYVSPVFHVTLVPGLLATLVGGGSVRLLDRPDAEEAAGLLRAGDVTRMFATPTLYRRILERLPDRSPHEVRLVFGAARAASGFVGDLTTAFPRARCFSGYGCTETGAVVRLYPADLESPEDRGVGRPVAGVRLAVVDPDDRPVPAGETGELAIWSPWKMIGYRGAAPHGASDLDHGGLRTGDLGWVDDAGFVHLRGRMSEMINTGGENVFPAEVEAVLSSHPLVADAAVYGVEDAEWGEQVEAAVVLVDGALLDPAALDAHCRQRLAGYKVPKRVRTIDELPTTANLKVDRRALAASAATSSNASAP